MFSKSLKAAKVSVVMCTYNGERFASEQLYSILNQSYPLHEIIIVDDCSTDNTFKIVEAIAKENNLIRLYKNSSNIGYNKNFEKALLLAGGDLIAISDQDDIWDTKKIETLIERSTEHTLLIYCNSVRFKDQLPVAPKADKMITPVTGSNPYHLAIRNTVSGHAMIIKKELLQLALPFDPNVYYDWWLAIVALCNGGIQHVPLTLVYQRAHDNNITLKRGISRAERLNEYKNMLRSHLKKFQAIPNLTKDQKLFFQTLHQLWEQSSFKKFNYPLFLFLLKNRKDLFKYKNRKFPFMSSLKYSLRYSYNSA